jgi:excisionase family DNA binding protein
VSRPFLVSLVDRGEIASYRVGTHRRIELEAVLRYRERRSDQRRELLKELSTEGQRRGLEY